MAEATIDRLQIEISSEATSAVASLDSLTASLQKLSRAISSPETKLGQLNTALTGLNTTLAGSQFSKLSELSTPKINTTAAKNITALSTAIESIPADTASRISSLSALSSLGGVTVSATLGNNISHIGTAVSALPADTATTLSSLATSLSGFSTLSNLNIGSAVSALAKLPSVLSQLQTLDVATLTSQMGELASAITPLAASVAELGTAVNSLPASLRTAGAAARSLTSSNKALASANTTVATTSNTAATGVTALGTAMKSILNIALIRMVANAISSLITTASDMVEEMNTAAVSLGEYFDEAYEKALELQEVLGISAVEWMGVEGTFMSIANGLGIASDTAYVMSENLTQLAYDIASFKNLSIEEATEKVRAGFVGETEPMLAIGIDVSTDAIAELAEELNLSKSVSEMSQAEKAALRYYLMIQNCTDAEGDLARTIESPANQLRILKTQFTLAAQAVGNLFIPILNKLIPVLIAVAQTIVNVAQTIADLLGIDITFEVDYSSSSSSSSDATDYYDDATDAAESATAAAEEYKNTVMGFDELHKLNDTTDSSSSSGSDSDSGSSSSILDEIPLITYDFLDGLTSYIDENVAEISETIEDLLPIIASVAAGLLAWKIASALTTDIAAVKGAALAVAGAVLYAWELFDAWNNGVDLDNICGMLTGALVLAMGLYSLFSSSAFTGLATALGLDSTSLGELMSGIGLVVAGIGMIVVSLKDVNENGLDWENLLGITAGVALAVSGGALIGAALGNAVLGAGLAGIAGGGILLVTGIIEEAANGFTWESFAAEVFGGAITGASIGGIVAGPVGVMAGAIIGALGGALVSAFTDWDGFSEALASIFDDVDIQGWIDEYINQPLTEMLGGIVEDISETASDWFDAGVELMEGLSEGIMDFFSDPLGWVEENIVEPFLDAFKSLFGISSSSTVMEEQGGYVMEGFFNGILGAVTGVGTWVNTNIVQPFVTAFQSLPSTVGSIASNIWSSITGAFGSVKTWFTNNVGNKISSGIEAAKSTIQTTASNAWGWVNGKFSSVKSWFQTNVGEKIGPGIEAAKSTIQSAASNAWGWVKDKFGSVKSWFQTNVGEKMGSGISAAKSTITTKAKAIWTAIKNVFKNVASFFTTTFKKAGTAITNIFGNISSVAGDIKDALYSAFKKVANKLIDAVNKVIKKPFQKINDLIDTLKGIEIFGIKPFNSLTKLSIPQISKLAEGGMVSSGQLFIAREAGPEMVGTIGGQTAVANNDQIVAGIEQGVYRAVMNAMSANSGGGTSSGDGGTIVIMCDSQELARAAFRGSQRLARRGEIKEAFA